MQDRWKIGDPNCILWDVANDTRLPHEDHIEMSGRRVSVIVRYRVDENRRLTLTREVIWPMLRTKEGDVRGYLRRTFGPESEPRIFVADNRIELGPVVQIVLRADWGALHIFQIAGDLQIQRMIYPSPTRPLAGDKWHFRNAKETQLSLHFVFDDSDERQHGVHGEYRIETRFHGELKKLLPHSPQGLISANFVIAATAAISSEKTIIEEGGNSGRLMVARYLQENSLALETPDPILNTAFSFAKLRTAESLFETQMGLVHSPGGGRYYGGIWNNDQCEYSGPLFGYLGDVDAKTAALTAYRNFAPYMTPEYKPIPTSLEMEGTVVIHAGGDRGDAAMYAGGAARFALATGDRDIAEELYPHIAWCLEYCRRRTNAQGVVESDTDELEGRFPTGTANLSTSCLAYDAYRRAADLARSLNRPEDAAAYDARADALADAIESYFGATVEGFETYRYYDGNETLRAWICLPLCFEVVSGRGAGAGDNAEREDISSFILHPSSLKTDPRASGTIAALFSPRLWTADGLATEAGDTVFWDRATLYALRGAFFAGATETALAHLEAYSRRRLLGDHVPYPVEAYPEGGQAHLSAESALYCRVFTEGLFGMVPTGLHSFTLTPRLPQKWPRMALRNIQAFGHVFSVEIKRDDNSLSVVVAGADGARLYKRVASDGETHTITLP